MAKKNARAKGNAIEKKAKQQLEAEGYLVHRTVYSAPLIIRGKFISVANNDLFGAFDLVAVKPGFAVRFIQVTDTGNMSARRHKIDPVADRFPIDHSTVEVWGWVGGAKRRDKRHVDRVVFVRRQYFKLSVFCGVHGWIDETPTTAGCID